MTIKTDLTLLNDTLGELNQTCMLNYLQIPIDYKEIG